jgi:SAM-dependent methyltransferase
MSAQTREVRRYYEANTGLFDRFSQVRELGTIRRAIWGPGVTTAVEAFHYVDRLIAAELAALQAEFTGSLRVFDFGCGKGASLIWLAAMEPAFEGLGISLSLRQIRAATARVRARGLTARLRCVEGDFLSLPSHLPAGQLVFAIEAFVHSPEPRSFFQAAARQLVPGGRLVICDDFLSERAVGALAAHESRTLEEFRHGWVAPALVGQAALEREAAAAGFTRIATRDLTPALELNRPRDRLVRATVAVARHLPLRHGYYMRSLIGGNALQAGLLSGLIEHRFVVFRRDTSPLTDTQLSSSPLE